MTRTVGDAVAVLDELYDPRWAESWDAVGLVTGELGRPLGRVLLAVDPVQAVIDEAVAWGADLLVTHHPLLLRGVHGVPATTPKGRAVTTLVKNDVALLVAHTNADVADPGVSDALAAALGVVETRPLRPVGTTAAPGTGARGTGRVGRLPSPVSLRDFGRTVHQALPPTAAGVRVAGDPDSVVTTVAVCGGAGDDLFDEVRASGADVYVTADLRHHPASEALEHGGPALVDCAHWATEWPWLRAAERLLLAGLGARPDGSDSVETRVSQVVTDPWTSLAADSRSPH
jgi:dinuclear metal center YbgI/SA1388 family protein